MNEHMTPGEWLVTVAITIFILIVIYALCVPVVMMAGG